MDFAGVVELRVSPEGESSRLVRRPYVASRVPLPEGSRGRRDACRRMLRGGRDRTSSHWKVERAKLSRCGRSGFSRILHWSLRKDPGLPRPAEFGPTKLIFYLCFQNREYVLQHRPLGLWSFAAAVTGGDTVADPQALVESLTSGCQPPQGATREFCKEDLQKRKE